MKIHSKILLITFPLIVLPAIIVGLVSFWVSQTAVQSIARKTLLDQLSKAIEICTTQASSIQGQTNTNTTQTTDAQAAAVDALRAVKFGNTGYILVVDATGFVLSHPVPHTGQQNISGETWFQNVLKKDKGTFTFTWEGQKRVAQYQRFPDWGWYVITTETEDELLGPMELPRIFISGLLAISLLFAFLAILILSRRLTTPLQSLLVGVDKFRRGELETSVKVTTNDEFGSLAIAFNNMAKQLGEMTGDLKQRISDRTKELEQRVLQMQAASEIAREAASTHELDSLLSRSVNQIQERFSFYHANIYSLDEQRQFAVLRAGSGEIGNMMIQRGYRVRIGDVGLVSHVAGTGETRVVNDVKTDFTYVKHPLLPETACAAAFPLKVGSRMIGVLNIENQRPNSFNPDLIVILQTLADQLAINIENARLLEELRNSLKETRSLYQNYSQETWSCATRGTKIPGYQFDLSQITSYNSNLPAEIRTRLLEGHAIPIRGQIPTLPGEVSVTDRSMTGDQSVLLAPLIMYSQIIGVLGVENNDPNHLWSSEEIALLEAISNQVSLTLDNARLVEETQLRSEQIRLLQEITAAAASHVKLNELLEAVTQRLLSGFNLIHCGVTLLDTDNKDSENSSVQSVSQNNLEVPVSALTALTSAPGAPSPKWASGELPDEIYELYKLVLNTHKARVVYGTQATIPTVLMVPLLTRGNPIGIITMEIDDTDRQYDQDALRLLEQIGLQVSTAIEVARNFEQTANRAEYERLIGEMTTRIRETMNVETMVKTAVKEVQQALGLPEVVIRLGLPTTRTSNTGPTLSERLKTTTGENA